MKKFFKSIIGIHFLLSLVLGIFWVLNNFEGNDNEIGVINNIFIILMSASVVTSLGIHLLSNVEKR